MLFLLALAATVAPVPTCTDEADCKAKWERAAQWVAAHNPTIEEFSDRLIRTSEPLGSTHKYQVTRIGGLISMAMACNPLRSCKRDQLKRDFYVAVMGTH